MKKQNLTKFALSLVCAAVLSACGGSGSDNAASNPTTPSVDEAAVKKQAIIDAAVKLGLTNEQAADFASKNATADTTKEADFKALVDAYKAALPPVKSNDINDQVDVSAPFTNFQITKNNKSNVGLSDVSTTTNDTTSSSRGKVELHPSFDTIVVATPKEGSSAGKTAYLEDFQFNATANTGDQLFTTYLGTNGLGFDKVTAHKSTGTSKFTLTGLADKGTDFKTASETIGERVAYAIDKAAEETSTSAYKTELAAQIREAKRQLKANQEKYKTSKADADLKEVNNMTAVVAILELGYENVKNVTVETYNDEGKIALAKAVLAPVITEVKEGDDFYYSMTDAGVEIAAKAAGTAAGNSAATGIQTALGANGRTNGEYTFVHGIYLDTASTLGGADRTATKQPDTETDTQGEENAAKALVYQTGRRIYITADNKEAADKMTYVSVGTGGTNNVRPLEDTVAEVYGNKTFTYEVGHGSTPRYQMVNDGGVNLPLANRFLSRVQYGRVTSKLHNVDPADLKDGVLKDTVVASYGKFGSEGTENIYFSRGSDHITADSLKALGTTGKLNYAGHAVAYGLDNSYDGKDVNAIPNAIGASYKLYSGNHVAAEINLADKTVTGSIFNRWTDHKYDAKGKLNQYNVDLVKFNGTLADNGNITGTSELTYGEKTKGELSAAIYGQQAQELGGAVQSTERADGKAWGAVFGAARVEDKAKAVSSPWDPRNEVR